MRLAVSAMQIITYSLGMRDWYANTDEADASGITSLKLGALSVL